MKLPRFGYGTYRAIILLPDGYRDRLGFDMPVFDSSYEIAVNGVTTARNGTPARSKAESIPAYEPLFFSYMPNNDTLELLIRVSNYATSQGRILASSQGRNLPYHTIQLRQPVVHIHSCERHALSGIYILLYLLP